ncbi:glycosyltransferase [Burkholderia multivorans]|uniref:glycosyltransferase n=1 Tax=Burkholderia multivorans TaxID=87883 RepID=UPI001B9517B8|nr:glycosyltransferase [Burkholderia multivorans]MBR8123356.1 glycosyltransferase [Burkholderia multivorans]MBU9598976.1 glycosyltransferase [Burkholderia multivorans]
MTQEKIVHIAEAFGGGVLSMLTQLANHAAAAGIDVTVLHAIRAETPSDFPSLFRPDVKLVYVDMAREVDVKHDLRSLRALVAHLRRYDPKVIHLHSSKAGVLGRVAARIATPHAAVFYSPHGLSYLRRDVSRMKQYAYLGFEQIAARIGGTVVACSASELGEIKQRVRARSAVLVENGVDVTAIPQRRPRDDGKIVVGMSGRASFQKNHEAFARLAQKLQHADVEFLWIGGNAAEIPDPAERRAVVCSGWVTRARALELTSGMSIYVQTSRWEGMPVALIEAQIAGIPAVVTDVIGNRDVVIHGVTGYVASSEDDMAAYVAKLRDDRQLREQMGTAARTLAMQRFSMSEIFRQWHALYGLNTDKTDGVRVDTRVFEPVAADHVKA